MQTTKADDRHNNTDDAPDTRPAGRDGKFLTTVNDVEFHFTDPVFGVKYFCRSTSTILAGSDGCSFDDAPFAGRCCGF